MPSPSPWTARPSERTTCRRSRSPSTWGPSPGDARYPPKRSTPRGGSWPATPSSSTPHHLASRYVWSSRARTVRLLAARWSRSTSPRASPSTVSRSSSIVPGWPPCASRRSSSSCPASAGPPPPTCAPSRPWEQAHLLEGRRFQALGLIEDQEHPAALAALLEQEFVQRGDQGTRAQVLALDLELLEQRLEELVRTELGIKEKGRVHIARKSAQQCPAQGRLPRTDFAGDRDEALALLDAVEEMRQRLAVCAGEKKKARIRAQRERLLAQAKEGGVHPDASLSSAPGEAKTPFAPVRDRTL